TTNVTDTLRRRKARSYRLTAIKRSDRGRQKQEGPTTSGGRSGCPAVRACFAGVWTHAQTIFKAIPRLPTQEILAVPRGGHHGLVGVSKHGGVSLSKIGPSVCNIDADEFTVVVARCVDGGTIARVERESQGRFTTCHIVTRT